MRPIRKKARRTALRANSKHFGQSRAKRQKKARRIRGYLILFGSLSILVAIIYIIFNANFFRIRSFIVQTSADTNHEKLINDLRLIISRTSRGALFGTDHYLAWPSVIPDPPIEFQSVQIKKSLTKGEVTIKAQPRTKYGLWCAQKPDSTPDFFLATCYWLDPTGIIFKEGPIAGGQLVPTIYETASAKLIPSKNPIIDIEQFAIIKNTLAGLRAINLSSKKINLNRVNQEIEIHLNSGPVIKISLRFDPLKTALPALAKLNNEGKLKNMDYIDLTVENRAFFK